MVSLNFILRVYRDSLKDFTSSREFDQIYILKIMTALVWRTNWQGAIVIIRPKDMVTSTRSGSGFERGLGSED